MEQLPLPWSADAPVQPVDAGWEIASQKPRRLVVDERQAKPKRARAISDACVTTKR